MRSARTNWGARERLSDELASRLQRAQRPNLDQRVRAAVTGVIAVVLSAAWPGSSAVAAPMVPLPPVDLGQTNILDGEGGPGALLEVITFGYGAGRLAGSNGGSAPGANAQQIISAIAHPILVSGATAFGAHPGIELLLPATYLHNGFAAGGSGSDTGLGDITLAPFLEWSPPHPGAGALSARLGLQLVAPTGDYSADAAVNTGHGGWQLSPYLAMTWRVSQRWEVSARAIYDWSSSIDGPATAGVTTRLQAGDLVALNASASYAVSPTLRLGAGGYLLRQVGASTVGGSPMSGQLQRVYALGPVLQGRYGQTTLFAAAYQEFQARNRPEGLSANIRLQHPF